MQSLATHLSGRDHKVCRLQIVPKGEYKPLFTDLYDETADVLVEAKGSVTRESIRIAIGQLIDYARFVPTARKVILLPSRPRPDLEELLRSAAIDMIWASARGVVALSIVDASVMPGLPRGNTNVPTIAIAERAADLIRGNTPLSIREQEHELV